MRSVTSFTRSSKTSGLHERASLVLSTLPGTIANGLHGELPWMGVKPPSEDASTR
jgi:hypothetical protein